MAQRIVTNGRFEFDVEVDDFSAPWKTDKTPILLQHGFGRAAGIWTTWVPHLCADYPLIRPNLRGLRQCPDDFDAARDLTMDAYLDDLCRILDDLGIERVHFCGESFGGCIGLTFAARHPDRVKSVSLVAVPVFQNQKWHETYSMGQGSWSKALEVLGVDAWLAETNKSTRFPASVDPDFVAWYNNQVGTADRRVLIGMAKLIETADLRPLLPQIEAPVLLMAPAGGTIMTDEQLGEYRRGVRDFTLVGFQTNFHKIQLLKAQECATQVRYFCSRADERAFVDF